MKQESVIKNKAGRTARHARAVRGRGVSGGFTLVEILVAMAIFVVLMSGITALFLGSVRTVRGGYRSMDAFGAARTAMTIMDRDLSVAFTARDQGQKYQFYGRPEGFMFVGALYGGGIGRITYVLHPLVFDDPANPTQKIGDRFETEIVESWKETLGIVKQQGKQYGFSRGMPGDEADQLGEAAQDVVIAAYAGLMPPDSDASRPVEFRVIVSTYALLRIEESGVRDLDSFALPGDLVWPLIDPEQVADDFDGSNEGLYYELLAAINPQSPDPTYDMRRILGTQNQNVNYPIHSINGRLVQQLIQAKRREIWIRMLSGDPLLDALDANGRGFASLGDWYWNEKDNYGNSIRNIDDFKLVESILYKTILLHPDSGEPLFIPGTQEPIDVLYVHGIFTYGNAYGNGTKDDLRTYFNDNQNIESGVLEPGEMDYPGYMMSGDPGIGELAAFDKFLTRVSESKVDSLIGSPLEPRLPYNVAPQFWLMMEKKEPGAPDFRKWFTQLVTVPSGFTREQGGVNY